MALTFPPPHVESTLSQLFLPNLESKSTPPPHSTTQLSDSAPKSGYCSLAGGSFRWRILQRRRISPDLSCNIVQNRAAPNLYSRIGFPRGQRCTFLICVHTNATKILFPMKHVNITPISPQVNLLNILNYFPILWIENVRTPQKLKRF